MRLITHNLLACHARNCVMPTNFPLHFKDCTRVEVREAEFNEEFMRGFLNKIDWEALKGAARELGDSSLPDVAPDFTDGNNVDEAFLKLLHHALLEIHVQDGNMICPQCGHVYMIKDGIPNMLLAEHEIRR